MPRSSAARREAALMPNDLDALVAKRQAEGSPQDLDAAIAERWRQRGEPSVEDLDAAVAKRQRNREVSREQPQAKRVYPKPNFQPGSKIEYYDPQRGELRTFTVTGKVWEGPGAGKISVYEGQKYSARTMTAEELIRGAEQARTAKNLMRVMPEGFRVAERIHGRIPPGERDDIQTRAIERAAGTPTAERVVVETINRESAVAAQLQQFADQWENGSFPLEFVSKLGIPEKDQTLALGVLHEQLPQVLAHARGLTNEDKKLNVRRAIERSAKEALTLVLKPKEITQALERDDKTKAKDLIALELLHARERLKSLRDMARSKLQEALREFDDDKREAGKKEHAQLVSEVQQAREAVIQLERELHPKDAPADRRAMVNGLIASARGESLPKDAPAVRALGFFAEREKAEAAPSSREYLKEAAKKPSEAAVEVGIALAAGEIRSDKVDAATRAGWIAERARSDQQFDTKIPEHTTPPPDISEAELFKTIKNLLLTAKGKATEARFLAFLEQQYIKNEPAGSRKREIVESIVGALRNARETKPKEKTERQPFTKTAYDNRIEQDLGANARALIDQLHTQAARSKDLYVRSKLLQALSYDKLTAAVAQDEKSSKGVNGFFRKLNPFGKSEYRKLVAKIQEAQSILKKENRKAA